MSTRTEGIKLVPNLTFIRGYAAALGINTWQLAWALTSNSPLIDTYQVFFGWSDAEVRFWNSFINSLMMVGMIIGSLIAGNIISKGRRRAAILLNTITILASILTMFKSIPLICIGRFFMGITSVIFGIIFGKCISETLPTDFQAHYGMLTNLFINFGFMSSFIFSTMLPTEPAKMEKDENWKLFSALPAITGFVCIMLFSLIFTEEPVDFCIANGREEEARRILQRVYRIESKGDVDEIDADTKDELFENQVTFRRSTTSMDTSKATFCKAVFGRKYRRASIVCFIINVFNQYTGITPAVVYAGRLVKKFNEDSEGTGESSFPLT